MLKFKNVDKDDNEFTVDISMSSVQGGILVEVARESEGKQDRESELVLMTPMDAAAFISDTLHSGYVGCRQVGHGKDGICLVIGRDARHDDSEGGLRFVGGIAHTYVTVGRISVAVPAFVVNAMRLCVERMMEAMLFPSTGSDEEEFG